MASDYIVTPGSTDNSEFKSKTIIFAGYGIADKNYDDYAGKDVNGKVVVIFSGEPKTDDKYIVSGTLRASVWGYIILKEGNIGKTKGAIALLLINPSDEKIPPELAENSKNRLFIFRMKKMPALKKSR